MNQEAIINSSIMNEAELETIILKYQAEGEETTVENKEEVKKWIKIYYPNIDYYEKSTGTPENFKEKEVKTIKDGLLILQAVGIGIGLCIIVWIDGELKKDKTKNFAQILNSRGFKRKKYDKIRKNFNLRMIIFEWIIGTIVIVGYYFVKLYPQGSEHLTLQSNLVTIIIESYILLLLAPIMVNRASKS